MGRNRSNATAPAVKGNLVAGTGTDTSGLLTVGANNTVLTADSTTATGLKWAAPDPLTTKGDLFTYSTTEARLGVGANNTILTADSTTATGLKWAAPASGGKVLQVVSSTFTSTTTITSASMTDTGISLSITPSSATSKILVFVNGMMRHNRDAFFSSSGAQLVRDASAVLTWTAPNFNSIEANGTSRLDTRVTDIVAIQYLDSPATTSSVTYKLQSQVEAASANATVIWQRGSAPSVMTLIEIGA